MNITATAPDKGRLRFLSGLIAAFALVAGFLVTVAPPAEAIVGGQFADAQDYPFMAAFNENGDQVCGASLIAPQWVLSAAHCVGSTNDPSIYSFTFGKSHLSDRGGETIAASQVFVHPLYASTGVHDVAIFKLQRSSSYEPIRVAHPATDRSLWEAGDIARVIGYGAQAFPGFLADYQLREVDVPVRDDAECTTLNPLVDPETEVCAGELHGTEDACQGDSGGPLFVRDEAGHPVQMGVVSWGWGCGVPTQYGVYSRVGGQKLYDWIQQTVGASAPVEPQEPEYETVTVSPRGSIAMSQSPVTTTEFLATCTAEPVSQGVDAYVWELPAELSVPGAIAQVGGYSPVGWPTYWDLDLAFYDETCTSTGSSATTAINERAAIPDGTRYVVSTAWIGADIPVELTVDIPITIEEPQELETTLELSSANPTETRFRDQIGLDAVLTDADGTPLSGQAVRFALRDAEGSIVQIAPGSPTDESGNTHVDLPVNVPAGNYTVEASFIGAPGEYLPSTAEGDLAVAAAESALTVAASGQGKDRSVTATLSDARDGVGLGARTVEIFADCVSIGSGETDADGTFTLDEVPPRYRAPVTQFSATFEGDSDPERYYSASNGGPPC